jgi:integrase
LASFTLINTVSAVRQTMLEAVALGMSASPSIANARMSPGSAETDKNAPYDADELAAILDAVRHESQYVLSILKGYQFVGGGFDPRIVMPGCSARTNHTKGGGWKLIENLRWYFENEMKGAAIPPKHPDARQHARFFSAAIRQFGGIEKVYRLFGVAYIRDSNLLGPLLVQLIYLTGLNPSSVVGLRADCLAEHPLAGVPVLRYLKKRSNGEKELFLDLLNEDSEEKFELEPAELTLRREQAVLVQRVIDRILQLTKPLRQRLPDDDPRRDSLCIYESTGRGSVYGQVRQFGLDNAKDWCTMVRNKYSLVSSDGSPLTFNLVRFRPTRLTEMARQGKDFFEIQHVAGHKSIRQTLEYIDQRTLDAVAEREVTNALETIWANRREFEPPPQSARKKVIPVVPFRGLVADCKNVFDPPRQVTLAADYADGQACTRYNMCLLCKNVVVMKDHLPILAHYRAQLTSALSNSATDLPHIAVYEKSLSVLDQVFDPETSEFSDSELEMAVEASAMLDVVIDPLVYTGLRA